MVPGRTLAEPLFGRFLYAVLLLVQCQVNASNDTSLECVNKLPGDSCILTCKTAYDPDNTTAVYWYGPKSVSEINYASEITVVDIPEDGDDESRVVVKNVGKNGLFPGGNVTVQKKDGHVHATLGFRHMLPNTTGFYVCVFQMSAEQQRHFVYMRHVTTIPPVNTATSTSGATGSVDYDYDEEYVDGRVQTDNWAAQVSGGALGMVAFVFFVVGGILLAMKRFGRNPQYEGGLAGKTNISHMPLEDGTTIRPPKGASRMANALLLQP